MQALERVGFEGHAVALRPSSGSREHVQEVEGLCAEPPTRLVCERKKSVPLAERQQEPIMVLLLVGFLKLRGRNRHLRGVNSSTLNS